MEIPTPTLGFGCWFPNLETSPWSNGIRHFFLRCVFGGPWNQRERNVYKAPPAGQMTGPCTA